jgi:ABC-type transporter Mla maintaining outer membrane lipid asymmetry permease subunit MlaE
MVAITPLYSIAVILSFVASQFTTVVLFGQSGGLYEHYFNTFLNPIDLLWSFLQAVLMAITILLIHTYFGYFATGGPSGSVWRWVTRCGLADRGRLGHPAGLPGHLRLQRQLQPLRIGPLR